MHSSSLFSGKMLETKSDLTDFVALRTANGDLQKENARLLQKLLARPSSVDSSQVSDTLLTYEVIPAKVINNSIMSLRNHITIDAGESKGITPSMGVITADGVIGVVKC